MKKVVLLFLTTFALTLNYSCTQDVDVNVFPSYVTPGTTNSNGQYAIAFSNYQNGQSTRALVESNSNTGYDDFSLYAWTENGTIMNPYHTQWVNKGWTYVGVDNQELQYFDNFIDEYNFIGIIPQQTNNPINNGKVAVATESFLVDNETMTDTPKEFLYATLTVPKAKYAEGLTVNFKHGNAKVYLKFTSDDPNTQIIDYAPSSPEVPATPATETYTNKTTKFIDELVARNEVQIAIGFYGVNSPKLTSTQPNPLYVGSNNTSNGWLAKDWLLSIKDAVNSQFIYYRLNQVNNSTSKTETTEDWESAASNKNIFMMKLADGVNATDFANGNDAFATALKAHQTDWVGGKPADSFWAMFEQAYAEGWRVIRINQSDTNPNQVLVFLSSNIETSTQVCTVTPGIEYQPAVIGKEGVVVLPATSTIGNGSDAVLATYPTKATAEVSLDGINWNTTETNNILTFSKPTTKVTSSISDDVHAIPSPTTWYALPCNDENVGYTVKVSYNYKGVNVYDARVFIPANEAQWEEGKYYTYIIQLNGKGNGHVEPNDVNAEDPTVNEPIKHEIKLFKVEFAEYGYGTTIIKEIK